MPSRQEYDNYYNPLIGSELDAYAAMSNRQNAYEKERDSEYNPVEKATLDERARMEAMISDMRHRKAEETREYARKLMIAQAKGQPLKLPTYNNQEVPVSDISYVLAESLQHLYSSEDPRAEYYDWVQTQRKIEVDIYSNGTTDDEIQARNDFIGFMDDRETELKLIIMLYQSAERNGTGYYKELAQNKLSFLNFKLSELRRLRDRTQATKSKSDEQEKREQELTKEAQRMAGNLAMAAAAEELEQTRQSYLQNQKDGEEFDMVTGGVLTKYSPVYRPEALSVNEVLRKKEQLENNRRKMVDQITAMRMGLSKEEQERQAVRQPLVRRFSGFNRREYELLENKSREIA